MKWKKAIECSKGYAFHEARTQIKDEEEGASQQDVDERDHLPSADRCVAGASMVTGCSLT